MFDHQEITSTIMATVAKVLCIPEGEIEPASPLFDLGADSLDLLDIFFRLEKQLGIEITLAVHESLTIEDVACFLRDHAENARLTGQEVMAATE